MRSWGFWASKTREGLVKTQQKKAAHPNVGWRRVMFKYRQILGRRLSKRSFSGVFETGDPRIQHVNSVSARKARFWGLKLAGEPLCPRLYCKAYLVKAKFVSWTSIKVIAIYNFAWPWVITNKIIFDH